MRLNALTATAGAVNDVVLFEDRAEDRGEGLAELSRVRGRVILAATALGNLAQERGTVGHVRTKADPVAGDVLYARPVRCACRTRSSTWPVHRCTSRPRRELARPAAGRKTSRPLTVCESRAVRGSRRPTPRRSAAGRQSSRRCSSFGNPRPPGSHTDSGLMTCATSTRLGCRCPGGFAGQAGNRITARSPLVRRALIGVQAPEHRLRRGNTGRLRTASRTEGVEPAGSHENDLRIHDVPVGLDRAHGRHDHAAIRRIGQRWCGRCCIASGRR